MHQLVPIIRRLSGAGNNPVKPQEKIKADTITIRIFNHISEALSPQNTSPTAEHTNIRNQIRTIISTKLTTIHDSQEFIVNYEYTKDAHTILHFKENESQQNIQIIFNNNENIPLTLKGNIIELYDWLNTVLADSESSSELNSSDSSSSSSITPRMNERSLADLEDLEHFSMQNNPQEASQKQSQKMPHDTLNSELLNQMLQHLKLSNREDTSRIQKGLTPLSTPNASD